MTFGFGSAWKVANRARIVEKQLQQFAATHQLKLRLRPRPVNRAFDASEVQADDLAGFFHNQVLVYTIRAAIGTSLQPSRYNSRKARRSISPRAFTRLRCGRRGEALFFVSWARR